jgi:hypothetical protein
VAHLACCGEEIREAPRSSCRAHLIYVSVRLESRVGLRPTSGPAGLRPQPGLEPGEMRMGLNRELVWTMATGHQGVMSLITLGRRRSRNLFRARSPRMEAGRYCWGDIVLVERC